MTFLPENYKGIPAGSSNYMKFKDGPNRFRILSSAVVGWQYWDTNNRPVRSKEAIKLIPDDIKLDKDGMPTPIKHFWAFTVWNYDEKCVQILEITQATIQRAMKIKIDNRDGDAKGYDFIITRTGEGLNTDYDIDVKEAAPLSEEIQTAAENKYVNLQALFEGADPFSH